MEKSIITSLSIPLVKQVRSLHQKKARSESGLFLVEGIHQVGEVIAAGWEIEAVLYGPDLLTSEFARELLAALRLPAQPVSSQVMESLADKENPQGILAVVRQRTVRIDSFHLPAEQAGSQCVALVSPQDPGNVGTILRTMDAVGVITIMADLLGFEAYGIELDGKLVATARDLASRFGSSAQFAEASFFLEGYRWRASDGDNRTGTLGRGPSGYLALGHALDEFDVVFAYGWDGEEPVMLDVMKQFGRADALLLLHRAAEGVSAWRGGRPVTPG